MFHKTSLQPESIMIKKIAKSAVDHSIKLHKSYKTRYGRKVRIICTDFNNTDFPIIAEVDKLETDDSSILIQYTASGRAKCMSGRKWVRGFDLVEIAGQSKK